MLGGCADDVVKGGGMTPFNLDDDLFLFGFGFTCGLFVMGMIWFLFEIFEGAV